jgi:AcrR family transcriptional regulator
MQVKLAFVDPIADGCLWGRAGTRPRPYNPQSPIPNPKSPIQNPQSPIQNPKSKIQNPKSPIPNPKSKIQNPKSKIQNPMPPRERLIQAAIELFTSQGVSETTTKQIAELAQVNEVTLFRQFGNKHSLLIAVIEDAQVFDQLGQSLTTQLRPGSSMAQTIAEYATHCLEALEQTPAAIRSLIGESGQYSSENRQGLGRSFERANQRVAEYLKTNLGESRSDLELPLEQLASLLNALLLGYMAIELTTDGHGLWRDRSDFLDRVVALFGSGVLKENVGGLNSIDLADNRNIPHDLPEPIVHQILDRAKKHSLQTYALVYVLFGAGLRASEIVSLTRSNHFSTSDRQVLQITQGLIRQVPVNQWIMSKRYGSYLKNPLTQWLKSRKDTNPALFIGTDGAALTEADLRQQWLQLMNVAMSPTDELPEIDRTPATWCVEMLMRGLTVEAIQILSGYSLDELEPYVRRAKEQTILLQAFNLDRTGG